MCIFNYIILILSYNIACAMIDAKRVISHSALAATLYFSFKWNAQYCVTSTLEGLAARVYMFTHGLSMCGHVYTSASQVTCLTQIEGSCEERNARLKREPLQISRFCLSHRRRLTAISYARDHIEMFDQSRFVWHRHLK